MNQAQSFWLLLLGGIFLLSSCQTAPTHRAVMPVTELHQIHGHSGWNGARAPISIDGAEIGYVLFDPESSEVVESSRENEVLIPASTTKLATTIAALRILGPEYRFETSVYFDGRDLYLRGTGDPFLTAADLMAMAQELSRSGVRKIPGRFYYDESFLGRQESILSLGDAAASYNPGVSALSSEFNLFSVRWKSGAKPSELEAYVNPDLPLFSLELAKSELPPGERFGYSNDSLSRGVETWLVSPTIGEAGKQSLPVRQPALYTAELFAHFCELTGVEMALPPHPGVTPLAKARRVVVHRSEPLVRLVDRVLEFSNNLMAELISLAAARKLEGHAVAPLEAAKVIESWWKKEIPRGPWAGFHLESGSGLTPSNRVSARQLALMLQYANQYSFDGSSFLSLLPHSGWKGTLTDRMLTPDLAFRVWAKTGTMYYGTSLGGYLYTHRGRKLIFAILINDLRARERVERVHGYLTEEASAEADQWMKKAKTLQDDLVSKWVTGY